MQAPHKTPENCLFRVGGTSLNPASCAISILQIFWKSRFSLNRECMSKNCSALLEVPCLIYLGSLFQNVRSAMTAPITCNHSVNVNPICPVPTATASDGDSDTSRPQTPRSCLCA